MFLFGQSSSLKGMFSSFLPSFSLVPSPSLPSAETTTMAPSLVVFLLSVYQVHVRLFSPEKKGGEGNGPKSYDITKSGILLFHRSTGSKGTNVPVNYGLGDHMYLCKSLYFNSPNSFSRIGYTLFSPMPEIEE